MQGFETCRGRTLPYSSCFGDVAPSQPKPEGRKSKRTKKRQHLLGEDSPKDRKDSPPARWVSVSPSPGASCRFNFETQMRALLRSLPQICSSGLRPPPKGTTNINQHSSNVKVHEHVGMICISNHHLLFCSALYACLCHSKLIAFWSLRLSSFCMSWVPKEHRVAAGGAFRCIWHLILCCHVDCDGQMHNDEDDALKDETPDAPVAGVTAADLTSPSGKKWLSAAGSKPEVGL